MKIEIKSRFHYIDIIPYHRSLIRTLQPQIYWELSNEILFLSTNSLSILLFKSLKQLVIF